MPDGLELGLGFIDHSWLLVLGDSWSYEGFVIDYFLNYDQVQGHDICQFPRFDFQKPASCWSWAGAGHIWWTPVDDLLSWVLFLGAGILFVIRRMYMHHWCNFFLLRAGTVMLATLHLKFICPLGPFWCIQSDKKTRRRIIVIKAIWKIVRWDEACLWCSLFGICIMKK